jgi:hypothetical protein
MAVKADALIIFLQDRAATPTAHLVDESLHD